LETRELLSVSPGDYAVVRESYQALDLPETAEEINIVELDVRDFTGESLQEAVERAGKTPENDLIILKADSENNVFNLGEKTLNVDVDSDVFGSISLVSYGGSGVSSLVSSSSCGAFNVVQGDFQLGGLIVVELGSDEFASPSVGLQTDQVAFAGRTFDSSSKESTWSVDYAIEGTERVFLTGLDEAQALSLVSSSTEKIFTTDVYYDADKTRATDSDENICWAASASNILWYTGWGQTGAFDDEQELFENVFVNNFSDKAGSSYYASKWFVGGEYPTNLDDSWSKPVGGGGYYQQAFKQYGDSVDKYVSYSNFLTSPGKTGELANKLQSGYGISASVEWYNKTTGDVENAHAVTVWGYAYDSALDPGDYGYYTGLYFTDSDDYQSEERQMRNMSLTWRSSCNIGGKYQGAYVIEGYVYNNDYGSNRIAALVGATFLAQRPTKYVSSTENKPNLYPSVVADGVSLLLTTTSTSTTDSDTFLAGSTIYTNFAFKSTKDVDKTVKCQLWLDGVLYKTTSYDSLQANQSYGPGSSNISLARSGVGSHTLRLVVDSDSAVDEYNENDNYFQRTFYILESDAIFVTTANDVVDADDGLTSLREAISLAGTSGYGSTVVFDSSLKGQTITLSSSLSYLYVQRAITIDASSIWDDETNSPGVTIDAQDNSNAFCLTGGTDANAVKLVGLAIINGSGLITSNDGVAYGGGVYAVNQAELIDCAFRSNKASIGGAVYCYQGSLTLRNCVFDKNSAESSNTQGGLGGAVYLYKGALNVSGSRFVETSSVSSGAIFAYESATVVSDSSFVENAATQYAGACYFSYGSVEITDSFFNGNSASSYAGALEFYATEASVSQCVFARSTSVYGGAVYAYDGSTTFTNSEFRDNTAEKYGGAIFLHGHNQHDFSNCALVDNRSSAGIGETLFVQHADSETSRSLLVTMRNCTVAGKSRNAIYIDGAQAGLKLYNSIVAGATYDVYANKSTTMEGYNVLSSFESWTRSSQTISYDSSKPLFTDANSGDYSLAFQSQALDVGLDQYALDANGNLLEYDILGEQRVICGTVDLGAYERALESTPETPTNLTFSAYDATNKTFSITWDDNSNVEYYYLVETSTDGKEWKTLKQTEADATSATLSGVQPGATYYARVSAANRAGSSLCDFAGRYVPYVPTAPDNAQVLKIESPEKTTYTILWDDKSTNESYFAIQISTDGKTWKDYAQTSSNVKSFESTEPLQYVRVAAGNGSGLSAYTAGSIVEADSTLKGTIGSGLCLKLDGVDVQTILWDFGTDVTMQLENGATIDPGQFGLTPGVSIITAQYADEGGAMRKSIVEVQISEVSPSLVVETTPSVNLNAAIFHIDANFAGRVVDRNWRVDWGDGTSTFYYSTHNFFISKYYDASNDDTDYEITLTLSDDSGSDVETFTLGSFVPSDQTGIDSTTMRTTGNDSIFEQSFEEVDKLEEALEEAINVVANSKTFVYGPLFANDVFNDRVVNDSSNNELRKKRRR